MKIKSIIAFVSVLVLFPVSNVLFAQSQSEDNQSILHELVVKMVDDEWRVVYKNDETKSTVLAKKNDRVSWTAEGSDISFQFDESLFGGSSFELEDGESLMRPLAPGAKVGEYIYAVFVRGAGVFAKGESPPRIIIDRM
ncbi:hypothetical protein [Rhodohalobacter barkolensis]|nr:hypothetical protein [Rhodohalobacter barkolensis]